MWDSRLGFPVEFSSVGLEGRSLSAAALGNQLHGWLAHPSVAGGSRTVEALSPRQGSYVAVLVHRLVGDEAQALPQRRAGVRISTVIEQKVSESGIALQTTHVRLRDDAAEQWGVATEAVSIDLGFGIDVRAMIDQPARDLDLVEINAHVQQSCARQRCAVQRKGMIGVASERGRIDFFVGKCSGQKLRIAAQVLLQQIDAAAMHGHRRRIRKSNTVL